MAQTGYTPIQLYYSTTTTNVPTSGNLASGELAINITDGKLFYKDNGGSVQVIAWKTTPTTAGGTGLTSWTAGDLPYYATGTTLSKLGIGTNGQVLTSTGTAPQWSTLSGVAVTTFSAGTTGFTPSSATSGAVTLAGTLATTNGGTGLTSFTANRVFYASSTSAIGQSANLTFDGTTLTANALTTTSTVTINGGTANGVAYLNGSKVLTTGSALTFNGSTLATSSANASFLSGSATTAGVITSGAAGSQGVIQFGSSQTTFNIQGGPDYLGMIYNIASALSHQWAIGGSEQARLTSTGLGIGTSSPSVKLDVFGRAKIDVGTYASGYALTLGAISETGRTYQIGMVTGNSLAIYDTTAAAQRIVLDSSGNLGLGVTPSAWSGNKAVQVNARTSLYSSADGGAVVGNNLYYNGTNNIYIASNYATAYQQNAAGQHIWYNAPSGTAGNAISFTQAMILDASGTLGLGVTPSAWGSVYKALQLTDGAAFAEGGGNTYVGNNWYNNGSSGIYIANGAAAVYGQSNGQHQWFNAPSGTAGTVATFTQAMTLTAAGDLGVGTTSPGSKLDVSGNVNASNYQILGSVASQAGTFGFLNSNGPAIEVWGSSSGNAGSMLFKTAGTERARITSDGVLQLRSGTTDNQLQFWDTGGTVERARIGTSGTNLDILVGSTSTVSARITSGGSLLVGTTTSDGYLFKVEGSYPFLSKGTGGAALTSMSLWNDATTGDNIFVVFSTEAGGTTRGSIDYNRAGGLVRYNTTSDYRAKDIIGPVQNTGTTIDALKVYEGVMKGATQARPMMIAHEAQEVVPFCVSGAKDETNEDGTPKYQQMDHASLVPLLIAELQSLRARVAQLEAK